MQLLNWLKRSLRQYVLRHGYVLLYEDKFEPGFRSDLTADERATGDSVAGRTMHPPHNIAHGCRCIEYMCSTGFPGRCRVWSLAQRDDRG